MCYCGLRKATLIEVIIVHMTIKVGHTNMCICGHFVTWLPLVEYAKCLGKAQESCAQGVAFKDVLTTNVKYTHTKS